MNESELRIGNWIKVNGLPPGQVTLETFKTLCDYPETIKYFNPIPLTTQMLDLSPDLTLDPITKQYHFAAGMVQYNIDINHTRFQGKGITVIAQYDNVQLAIATTNFAHQLQNLFQALTNKEIIL
jgi:hypothetical protein